MGAEELVIGHSEVAIESKVKIQSWLDLVTAAPCRLKYALEGVSEGQITFTVIRCEAQSNGVFM